MNCSDVFIFSNSLMTIPTGLPLPLAREHDGALFKLNMEVVKHVDGTRFRAPYEVSGNDWG